jgi:signal peptidase I
LTDVPDLLIKRVIGFPGDRIRMVGGAPSINGWRVPSCDAGEYLYVLPEPSGKAAFGRLHVEFLDDRAYLALYPLTEGAAPTEYAVKKDEVFVLGDNRKNSIDSRVFASGKGGGVALTAIEGRASRFLIGSRRGGDFDFARWLAPIDRPLAAPGLAGFASDGVEQAVRRCLANRPKGTTPPSPLEGVSLASAGDAP